MFHRLFYRLKYTAGSIAICGVVLLFLAEWRIIGMYAVIGGIIFYVVCNWLQQLTKPKQSFDADKNGNAKPNYR